MDRSTLLHHARPGGRYERVRRGLYRLRHFPSSPHEHVVAAWLPLPKPAVVSHESALELFELSDVIPNAVHITLPRANGASVPDREFGSTRLNIRPGRTRYVASQASW